MCDPVASKNINIIFWYCNLKCLSGFGPLVYNTDYQSILWQYYFFIMIRLEKQRIYQHIQPKYHFSEFCVIEEAKLQCSQRCARPSKPHETSVVHKKPLRVPGHKPPLSQQGFNHKIHSSKSEQKRQYPKVSSKNKMIRRRYVTLSRLNLINCTRRSLLVIPCDIRDTYVTAARHPLLLRYLIQGAW